MTSPISFTSPTDPTQPGVYTDVAVTVAAGTYVESAVITLTGSLKYMPMWAPTGWTLSSTMSSDQSELVVTVQDVSNMPAGGTTSSELLTLVEEYFTPQKASFGPTYTITVNSYTDTSGTTFSPVTGNTLSVTAPPACFVSGTRLATPAGAIAVEQLRKGDLVLTHSGATRPIVSISSRDIELTRARKSDLLQPICLRAHCVADNIPEADVCLSPDHAVLLDGMLIHAHALVNGRSIVRDKVPRVTYWHVELETHDILLAENLPAESYLDCGSRHVFEGQVMRLHADFSTPVHAYASHGAAPLVTDPARVRPVWQRLADRAGMAEPAGWTQDPAVSLLAEGRTLSPQSVVDGRYLFVMPAPTRSVALLSRSARPSDRTPWCGDRRRLGVAVVALWIDGEAVTIESFTQGWYPVERDATASWRWTDGDARMELPVRGRVLEVLIGGTMRYDDAKLAG